MGSAAVKTIESADQASAMMSPIRLRLLRELSEPDSASGLSRKLEMPRQQLNYHLKDLERHGLVELVEEKRRGNCTERLLRAVARSYVISPSALGSLGVDPNRVEDRFSSAYLVAVAASFLSTLSARFRSTASS